MPCGDAMFKDVVTVTPDQTVAEVLSLFEKHGIRAVPVVDADKKVVGVYAFNNLLLSLLPMSGMFGEGIHGMHTLDISLDHLSGSAPWVARRLKNIMHEKLEDVMVKDPATVREDTPLREGIRLMVKYGSPLPVVKSEKDKTLVGLISSQTAIKTLLQIAEHVKKGKEVEE